MEPSSDSLLKRPASEPAAYKSTLFTTISSLRRLGINDKQHLISTALVTVDADQMKEKQYSVDEARTWHVLKKGLPTDD